MSHVLMHDGKPVRTGENRWQIERYAQTEEFETASALDFLLWWTGSGKLMARCRDGSSRFTGWEVATVSTVGV